MPVPLQCAGIGSWEALLDTGTAPEQRALLEQHLESCAACQARLDYSVELENPLLGLARRNGDPTAVPRDPTFDQVLERLQTYVLPFRPITSKGQICISCDLANSRASWECWEAIRYTK
jgi:hypothetical protein